MKNHQPITLGELIELLAQRPPEQSVRFDFCHHVPAGVGSYRGYYDHLALAWRGSYDGPKVADFLKELQAAVGKVYEGYKGGDFRMSRKTPMWVSNYGESDSVAVVGVGGGYITVIETGYCEDWDGGLNRVYQVMGGLGFGNAHLPMED